MLWMTVEQDLADVLQIVVQDLSPDHVTDDGEPALKQLGFSCQFYTVFPVLC